MTNATETAYALRLIDGSGYFQGADRFGRVTAARSIHGARLFYDPARAELRETGRGGYTDALEASEHLSIVRGIETEVVEVAL